MRIDCKGGTFSNAVIQKCDTKKPSALSHMIQDLISDIIIRSVCFRTGWNLSVQNCPFRDRDVKYWCFEV